MPLDRAIQALIDRANGKAVLPEQAGAQDAIDTILARWDDDQPTDGDETGEDEGTTYTVPPKVAQILAPFATHWDYFGLYEDFMALIGKDPSNPTGSYPGWMRKWQPGDGVPKSVQKLFATYEDTRDDEPEPEPAPAPVEEPVAETPSEPAPAPVEEPVAETPSEPAPAPAPVEEPVAETPSEPAPAPAPVQDERIFGWIDENTYLSGGDTPDGFNIELIFHSGYNDAMKAEVAKAAEMLSDLVTGDLADYNGIDDLRINAYIADLSSWASGGVTTIRPEDSLSAVGRITFDPDRIAAMLDYQLADQMAAHEMLHAMGFGSGLSAYDLTATIGGTKRFIGETAIKVYNEELTSLSGTDPYASQGVPMDGSHWPESFGRDILTATVSSADKASNITLAALEDMGYETVYPDEPEEQQEFLFF